MSSSKSHLWLERTTESDGAIRLSAVIERPRLGRSELWYRIPPEFAQLVYENFDAILVGQIFLLMEDGSDCIVHGQASPLLLRNLEEFQSAWVCWRPDLYKQLEIVAETEVEEDAASPDLAVAAFTGGVDSCFTMYRHRKGTCGLRWRRQIDAGLFVHGFDIPLSQENAFERAAARAQKTLQDLDVKLITMSTNHKELNPSWDDTHVSGITSCLMLLKGRYREGLIASGCAYSRLLLPWGSNPATDHLLSSQSFRVSHDGANVNRSDKVDQLAGWDVGFQNLRVCYSAERADENCGICLKCVLMILRQRLYRKPIPQSFPELTDHALSNLDGVTHYQLQGLRSLLNLANNAGIEDSWVQVLAQRVEALEEKLDQTPLTYPRREFVRSPLPPTSLVSQMEIGGLPVSMPASEGDPDVRLPGRLQKLHSLLRQISRL